MSERRWEVSKTVICDHIHRRVALETEVVYPGEYLPDQPPRVLAHRCSRAITCNQTSKPACIWAGTNPGYDPFRQ